MNDNEILATGELCQALLASEKFGLVVAQYEQSIAADIIATRQEDKQKREDLYNSLWGTRGLLAFMKLHANAAAQILQPRPPIDSTTDPVPYDEYGYDWRAEEEEFDY